MSNKGGDQLTIEGKSTSLKNFAIDRRLYALRKAEQRGAVSTVRYTVIDPSSRSDVTENCDPATNGVPLIREVPGFEWDRSCNLD